MCSTLEVVVVVGSKVYEWCYFLTEAVVTGVITIYRTFNFVDPIILSILLVDIYFPSRIRVVIHRKTLKNWSTNYSFSQIFLIKRKHNFHLFM